MLRVAVALMLGPLAIGCLGSAEERLESSSEGVDPPGASVFSTTVRDCDESRAWDEVRRRVDDFCSSCIAWPGNRCSSTTELTWLEDDGLCEGRRPAQVFGVGRCTIIESEGNDSGGGGGGQPSGGFGPGGACEGGRVPCGAICCPYNMLCDSSNECTDIGSAG